MDKKPNVFPKAFDMQKAMEEANQTGDMINEQLLKETTEAEAKGVEHVSQGELSAAAQMEKQTLDNLEVQMKARDEAVAKQKAIDRGEAVGEFEDPTSETPITYAPKREFEFKAKESEIDLEDVYAELSKPQEDMPYDSIKLPSGGLVYKNHKSTIDVAYLNATDEDIITNPNLLQTGRFLEVLINRKLVNTHLKYKDLHVGDRNAIMIWLRATGYGSAYNVKLRDPETVNLDEFEVTINLDKLPLIPLGAKPDSNGYFDYILPLSKDRVKFKLLSVGDVDAIEEHIEGLVDGVRDVSIFTLRRQIVSYNKGTIIDGQTFYHDEDEVTDVGKVIYFTDRIRLGDVIAIREYVEKIESGVDMNLTVGTPGGGSVSTFLPLNLSFFWPNVRI